MRLNFSVPVIALLAGAAIGFCLRPTSPQNAEATDESAPKERAPAQIADADGAAGVEALRNRIKELEGLLASEANRRAQNAEAVVAEGDNPPRREGPGRFNPREMMERMKAEDPERYAQMTNRMAQFRNRRTEQAFSKLEFLASLDTSGMSEEAQETHSRLQTMIVKREELEDRLHSETISDDDRENAMREMFAMEREIHELNNQERANLINETVRELGFTGEDADDIVGTINDILKVTMSNFGPPGGPGGPRPGGPGPGRR